MRRRINNWSLILTLSTLVAVMFRFNVLREYCVCISNYLAWSWIAFGISLFIGLFSGLLIRDKYKLLCSLLQATAFYAGIVFMVLFGARLLDVI